MKKSIITILIIAILVSACTPVMAASKPKKQDNLSVKVYDPDKLTFKILNKRKSNILIIERCVGVVTNSKRDGKIFNTKSKNNYISYRRVKGAKKGDKIVSFFIYNPYTQYDDDIVCRLDEIIETKNR